MSIATTLKLLDQALLTRYSGLQIYVGDPAVLTAVTTFVEEPYTEEYKERVYPSVSILFSSMLPDHMRSEADEGGYEEVGVDETATPNENLMRMNPEPYRINYRIQSNHRTRVSEDRDLVSQVMLSRTPTRGYMTVKNIDGEDIDVWVMWSSGMGPEEHDERDQDMMIFHKSINITILAHLALVPADEIVREKVVAKVRWGVSSRKSVDTGEDFIEFPGEDVLDMEFEYDDTTEGPV